MAGVFAPAALFDKTAASENDSGRGPPTTCPDGYRASCSFSAMRVVAANEDKAELIVCMASLFSLDSSLTSNTHQHRNFTPRSRSHVSLGVALLDGLNALPAELFRLDVVAEE